MSKHTITFASVEDLSVAGDEPSKSRSITQRDGHLFEETVLATIEAHRMQIPGAESSYDVLVRMVIESGVWFSDTLEDFPERAAAMDEMLAAAKKYRADKVKHRDAAFEAARLQNEAAIAAASQKSKAEIEARSDEIRLRAAMQKARNKSHD
jgi:hypothetical protein